MDRHQRKTRPFPGDRLHIKGGTLRHFSIMWSIELKLNPFDLPTNFEEGEFKKECENIETEFQIDFFYNSLNELQGRITKFEEPHDYVEGSLYIVHAHHPIDITYFDATDLSLESPRECELKVKFTIDFPFEGLEYDDDTDYNQCSLSYTLNLTPNEDGWSIGPASPD